MFIHSSVDEHLNSFYDSYLDLQEQFLRYLIVDAGLDASARETCGALLKRNDVRDLCLAKIGMDKSVYDKMEDYTLKVNAHKHKGEKKIQLETIINYMRVFFEELSAVAVYRSMGSASFDSDYYTTIFCEYEKENAALKEETQRLKDDLAVSVEEKKLKESDLARFQGLLSATEIEKMDIEAQNVELQRQISALKDIKLSSMEEKLNRTIDLLLELKPAIVENRIITRAVGNGIGALINGENDNVEKWLKDAKKEDK